MESKEIITKRQQRILRVITLNGAIEKNPVLLVRYWKNLQFLNLFPILNVPILFCPRINSIVYKRYSTLEEH